MPVVSESRMVEWLSRKVIAGRVLKPGQHANSAATAREPVFKHVRISTEFAANKIAVYRPDSSAKPGAGLTSAPIPSFNEVVDPVECGQTDGEQINGHHVAEATRHKQYKDASDNGGDRQEVRGQGSVHEELIGRFVPSGTEAQNHSGPTARGRIWVPEYGTSALFWPYTGILRPIRRRFTPPV
jgi:hypothetical protein